MIGREATRTHAKIKRTAVSEPNASCNFGLANFVATLPKNSTRANITVNIVYLPETDEY